MREGFHGRWLDRTGGQCAIRTVREVGLDVLRWARRCAATEFASRHALAHPGSVSLTKEKSWNSANDLESPRRIGPSYPGSSRLLCTRGGDRARTGFQALRLFAGAGVGGVTSLPGPPASVTWVPRVGGAGVAHAAKRVLEAPGAAGPQGPLRTACRAVGRILVGAWAFGRVECPLLIA